MELKVNIQVLPVDQIKPNPWNPNRQTDFIFERELTSIKTHGFLDPVLVRQKEGFVEVIDGEHRLRAATQLGMTQIPVNNLGDVPDEIAKQLTIIMNETRGQADQKKLAELVASLNQSISIEQLTVALPYTVDQLQHMVAEVKVDWEKINAKPPEEAPKETKEEPVEEGFTIFQCKLKNEVHQQLMHQINRVKMQMAPGEDPSNVSTADALERLLQHIIPLDDAALLKSL